MTTNVPATTETCAPFVIPGVDSAALCRPPYIACGAYAPAVEQKITHEGRTYLLRTLFENVIMFRDAARNLPEWTYFLRYTPADTTAASLTSEQFRAALEWGEIGRVVACKPGGKYGREIFNLLLSPDGTGLYLSSRDRLEFNWNWRKMGLDAQEDLLSADFIELDLLECGIFSRHCTDIIECQLSKRMKNPYVAPGELQDSPFAFSCGSEEELRRVTLWICHSDDDLFDEKRVPVNVQYVSPGDRWRTHYRIERHGTYPSDREKVKTPRLRTLLRLAYKQNTFTGWEWTPWRGRRSLRRKDYLLSRSSVYVTVEPPSAHERAEALLALSEWLEGKVPLKKRMRLLGLE